MYQEINMVKSTSKLENYQFYFAANIINTDKA